MPERVPPGRAGRLWLVSRLAFAQRSLELLDRKYQLLLRELEGLAEVRDEARRRWADACSRAELWGLRASALGGRADVALAAGPVAGRAYVEVPWRNTMGVVHPGEPRCVLPDLPPDERAAANSAVAPAAAAYREALDAAAACAVAERSHHLLDVELRATARRRRAVEHHRLPFLREALSQLELRLDEIEREERVLDRWVRDRSTSLLARADPATGNPDKEHSLSAR